MSDVTEVLESLIGRKVPGGCNDCDAYQTVTRSDAYQTGIFHLTVHHDDTCPELRARRAK